MFKFDNTAPTLTISTTATTRSIRAIANATAASGISKYEYSIDNGGWIDGGTDNIHEFTNLEQGTNHTISVRVTSGVGKTTTTNVTESTVAMTKPTYTEEGVYPKTVIIHFPEGCADGTLTCTYQKDNGTTETVTDTTAEVSFDNHGTIAAYVSDGVSTVSSSYTVTIKLKAADLSYDNTNTGMDCVDAQCALDAIKKMLE